MKRFSLTTEQSAFLKTLLGVIDWNTRDNEALCKNFSYDPEFKESNGAILLDQDYSRVIALAYKVPHNHRERLWYKAAPVDFIEFQFAFAAHKAEKKSEEYWQEKNAMHEVFIDYALTAHRPKIVLDAIVGQIASDYRDRPISEASANVLERAVNQYSDLFSRGERGITIAKAIVDKSNRKIEGKRKVIEAEQARCMRPFGSQSSPRIARL